MGVAPQIGGIATGRAVLNLSGISFALQHET